MLNVASLKAMLPLSGEQVELCLFVQEDITDVYVAWLNDPEVVRYSNQRFKQHTIASCRDYLASFNGADAIFVSIREKQNRRIIGTMTVYFNIYHESADMGIMLGDRAYWGKGLGKDAWHTLMRFLLDRVGVRKVTAGTLSCNKGMISIMRSVGMAPDGMRVAQELVDGQAYDIVYFAVLSS